MLFSESFKIKYKSTDSWFDPILNHDTKLFIDPFLIFQSGKKEFKGSHKKLISFFNEAFKLAAKVNSESDIRYKKLLQICVFPEADEVCLGYSHKKGTSGAGSGGGYSKKIVSAIHESIRLGVQEIDHFEKIGILNEGFGCDRISDATIQILKQEFIIYTQSISNKHKVKTKKLATRVFNISTKTWRELVFKLPENPFYRNRPIILVPKEFIRNLPTLDKGEFFDFCWSNYNEVLRTDFNIEIKSEVDVKTIIEIARRKPNLVDAFIKRTKAKTSRPYDVEKDIKGLYKWHSQTREYALSNPLVLDAAKDLASFESVVDHQSHYC